MIPMQLEDAMAVAALEAQLFPSNNLNETSIKLEIQTGEGWVVKEDGEVVAYLLGRWGDGMFDVLRLGVIPECRGRKLGSRLLDHVLQRYLPHPTILTVEKTNQLALDMYLKRGFKIVGELSGTSWVLRRTH
jgi:ribosomal protein S18 acetylase RimI-like enzyme